MPDRRIAKITLDERSVVRLNPNVDHERAAAIGDLLHANSFAPASGAKGPFNVHLGIAENRFTVDIADATGRALERVQVPIAPFRTVVKDYFVVCDTYYNAIRQASPTRVEAIDMGRRSLHDEGSTLLREKLADKVTVDFDTARRLFTLLCVLHIRG